MPDEPVLRMVADRMDRLDQRLDAIDARQREHGEMLARITTQLEGLPCRRHAEQIGHLEDLASQGKGAKWAAGLFWSAIVAAAGLVAFVVGRIWK